MPSTLNPTLPAVDWQPQPQAAACVRKLLAEFPRRCRDIGRFQDLLHNNGHPPDPLG